MVLKKYTEKVTVRSSVMCALAANVTQSLQRKSSSPAQVCKGVLPTPQGIRHKDISGKLEGSFEVSGSPTPPNTRSKPKGATSTG